MKVMAVDQDICLNRNYNKRYCRKCQEACPMGCINDALQIDADLCNQCGLCVSACPADAFVGLYFLESNLNELYQDLYYDGVNCLRQNSNSPWPCLGFLSARTMLALAFVHDGFVLDMSACENCKPGVSAYLEKLLYQVNITLASIGKNPIITGTSNYRNRKRPVSRRAFLGELLGAAAGTLRETAAPTEQIPERLNLFGHSDQILHGNQEVLQQADPMPFLAPIISQACKGCGLCVKVCPQQALSLKDKGELIELYHDPLRCRACGACVSHCPHKAMNMSMPGHVGQYLLHRAALPRCAVCGQLFQPLSSTDVCLECRLKGNIKEKEEE